MYHMNALRGLCEEPWITIMVVVPRKSWVWSFHIENLRFDTVRFYLSTCAFVPKHANPIFYSQVGTWITKLNILSCLVNKKTHLNSVDVRMWKNSRNISDITTSWDNLITFKYRSTFFVLLYCTIIILHNYKLRQRAWSQHGSLMRKSLQYIATICNSI